MIFAEDEAFMYLQPTPTKLWAPRGSRPTQLVNGKERGKKNRLCLFGACSNECVHTCTAESVNSETFRRFVRYLHRTHKNRKLALVLDRGTHHISGKIEKLFEENSDWLETELTPPKLPKLNPQEHGWRYARKNVTYKLFEDKKILGRAVQWGLYKGFKPDLFRFWG